MAERHENECLRYKRIYGQHRFPDYGVHDCEVTYLDNSTSHTLVPPQQSSSSDTSSLPPSPSQSSSLMSNNSLHNSHRYHLHLLQFNLHLLSALDLYFQSQYLLLLILFLTKLIITIRQRLFLIETYDIQNEIGLKTSIHMVVKVDSLLLLDLKIMNPFFKRSNGIRYTMNCCHRTMPLS